MILGYQVNAQESTSSDIKRAEFGFRFMPTFASFDMKNSEGGTVKGKITLGYGIGGFIGFNFSNYVGIQAEVIYNSISQKYKEDVINRKIVLRYLNIPLLLSLNTGKSKMVNFNIVAGPQVGISVGSTLLTEGDDGTNSNNAILKVKKGDLGLAYGAGLDFGLNAARTIRLGVGFRGVYGLLDISNHNNTTETNSYYLLDKTNIKTYSLYSGLSILF